MEATIHSLNKRQLTLIEATGSIGHQCKALINSKDHSQGQVIEPLDKLAQSYIGIPYYAHLSILKFLNFKIYLKFKRKFKLSIKWTFKTQIKNLSLLYKCKVILQIFHQSLFLLIKVKISQCLEILLKEKLLVILILQEYWIFQELTLSLNSLLLSNLDKNLMIIWKFQNPCPVSLRLWLIDEVKHWIL